MLQGLCSITQSIALLSTLAVAGIAIQLALRPLYGSVAPALHHTTGRTAVYLLSTIWPFYAFPSANDSTILASLASFIACLPYLIYTLGKWLGKLTGDPVMGASLTVLPAILPLILSSILLLKRWNVSLYCQYCPF